MKPTKLLALLLASVAFLPGCSSLLGGDTQDSYGPGVLMARIGNTKTALVDGNKISWLPTDKISVYDGASTAVLGNDMTEPASNTLFSVESGSMSELPATYSALYPSSVLYSWDEGGYDVSFTLPTTQNAVPDGIGDGCDLLVAQSTTSTLTFSHVLSALKFTIDENSPYITSISVTAGVKIAGRFGYNFSDGSITVRTGTNTVTLALEDGGVLPEGNYYIFIPARNYKAALTVEFTDDQGNTDTRTISAGKTPVAGTVYPLGTVSGLDLHVPLDVTTRTAADLSAAQISSAAAYRSASMTAGGTNSTWINQAAFNAYSDKAVLAARLSMLGFKAVYLSPGADKIEAASDDLKTFISECSRYRIKVYYSALDSNTQFLAYNSAAVDRLLAYNEGVTFSKRFAGIAADVEPQTCKEGSKPDGLAYTWDPLVYGKGGDNDILLGLTLDILEAAGTSLHAGGVELGEAINYNFQINQDAGLLNNGNTGDFLDRCDFVTVMAYLTDKVEICTKSAPCLAAAGKARTVSVAISTKNGGTGSIYSYGWSNLLDVLEYVRDESEASSSFRGIDIFGFADFMQGLLGVEPE